MKVSRHGCGLGSQKGKFFSPLLGKAFLKTLFVLSLFLFIVSPAHKADAISYIPDGTVISSNTVWEKTASPYVIQGSVTVQTNITLTIKEGVVVKFAPNAYLAVWGQLKVLGLASDKVSLTSLLDDTVAGDTNGDGNLSMPSFGQGWGIDFLQGTSPHSIKNAEMKYLRYGLWFDSTSGDLDSIKISESKQTIGAYNSTISLRNSSLTDFEYGIYADVSEFEISDTLFKDVISDNGDAIDFYSGVIANIDSIEVRDVGDGAGIGVYDANVTITNSTFSGGGDTGVEIYNTSAPGMPSLKMSSSTIEGYYYTGIGVYGGEAELIGVKVIGNGDGIDVYSGTGHVVSSMKVSQSLIADNADMGIFNFSNDGFVVDARNNYWGDPSGPNHFSLNPNGLGDYVSDNVLFDPWLASDPTFVEPPPPPTGFSSVIFIPGLQASRLYKQQIFENQLWEPNRNSDVEKLYLNSNGVSLDQSIYTRDVIDEVNVSPVGQGNIYKSFMSDLDDLVAGGKIQAWEALPYDWREDIEDIATGDIRLADGATYRMISEIEARALSSFTGKVSIVAHSNGGLVAKMLIKKLEEAGKEDLIDKLILVAVPQLGTPKAIAGLLHGDGQSLGLGAILSQTTARELGENMPGAYSLLPSPKYFDQILSPVITFAPSLEGELLRDVYGEKIDDFDEFQRFLTGFNDNRIEPASTDTDSINLLKSNLLAKATSTHISLDNYSIPSNIKVSQIVGWGLDTISGIEYYGREVCNLEAGANICVPDIQLKRRPIFTIDGDETVVSPSADAYGGETYYFNLFDFNHEALGARFNRSHKDILEPLPVIELVTNLINEINFLPPHISTNKPVSDSGIRSLRVSVHSPVSLDIYDSLGNHTGLTSNLDPDSDLKLYEEKIPNSYYKEFGEDKYVGAEMSGDFNIYLEGQGYGSFTLDIAEIHADAIASTTSFIDLPVVPTMIVETVVSNLDTTPMLTVDVEGDGINDYFISPMGNLDPILFLQVMRKAVVIMSIDKGAKDKLLRKLDKAIIDLQLGKLKKTKEAFNYFLTKLQMKKFGENLSPDDSKLLIAMINELLDNLR